MKETFVINYHNGLKDEVHAYDLDHAKEIAERRMSYTQRDVSIQSPEGEVYTNAYWYGVKLETDDSVLVAIAEGFYQTWDDEL